MSMCVSAVNGDNPALPFKCNEPLLLMPVLSSKGSFEPAELFNSVSFSDNGLMLIVSGFGNILSSNVALKSVSSTLSILIPQNASLVEFPISFSAATCASSSGKSV